jgi:PPM family protein phosphatase
VSVERVHVPEPAAPGSGTRRLYRFESAALSDPGGVRDHNEDFVVAGQNLVAVADGVGGAVFGEVASEIVIAAISYLDAPAEGGDPAAEMNAAVECATERLRVAIADDESRAGMATTLTALRLAGPLLVVGHVGDSRAYGLRDGRWRQLTRDDSLVQDLVDAGAITAAQALRHPARSVVLQALNGGPVSPHVTTHEVAPGDRYLVCSDGLTDYVDEATISTIVSRLDAAAGCTALVEAAFAVGAPDNVSCVIADVRAG